MTDPERGPSRAEFRDLARRVNDMNKQGSRPVVQLAATVAKIARDLADLKRQFEAHERARLERRAERIATRRWVIGTCITALVALVAVIGLLLSILARVH